MKSSAHISPRVWAACCAAIAGALTAAMAALCAAFPELEPVTWKALGTGPTSNAGTMILTCALCALWAAALKYRCSDVKIRRRLTWAMMLCIHFNITMRVKWAVSSDWLTSILWYSYYIPMIVCLTLLLLSSMRAANIDATRGGILLKRAIITIDAVLLALIMTNNLHHLAFVFDQASPRWAGEYTYGWLYWITLGWMVVQFAAYLVTTFRAARRQLRAGVFFLLVIGMLALGYAALYIFAIPNPFTKSLSLAYAFFALVVAETSLDLHILPSHVWRKQLLLELPYDLRVLDDGGRTYFKTNAAAPIADSDVAILIETLGSKRLSVKELDHNQLVCTYPVSGGIAMLSEDITALSRNRRILEAKNHTLVRRSRILKDRLLVDSRQRELERERVLLSDVDSSLAVSLSAIRAALDEMHERGELSDEEKRSKLAYIKLNVSYCKRKGYLVAHGRRPQPFEREVARMMLNEIAVDLQTAGIECAALVEFDEPLPPKTLSTLVDCVYSFAFSAFAHDNPVIMIFLKKHDECSVALRVAMSNGALSQSPASMQMSLEDILSDRDVVYRVTETDSSFCLTAIVPLEQKSDGGAL